MNQHSTASPERRQRFLTIIGAVNQAVQAQDIATAIRWSQTGLDEGFAHPNFLNLVAYREIQGGRPKEALRFLTDARKLAPTDTNILNAMGTCHASLGQSSAALEAFDAAIAIAPAFAPAYYNRALVHESLGDLSRARIDFERAVAIHPAYAEALARLAYSATLRGEHKSARDYAHRALQHDPQDATALMAMAMADISERKFLGARSLLAEHLGDSKITNHNRAILFGLMGDALDGLDDTRGAFEAYSQANEIMRTAYASLTERALAEQPCDQVERLITYFEAARRDAWTAQNKAPGMRSAPVFLVGFPRSGTTLLEQVLAGHPNVLTSEEKDILDDAVNDFIVPQNTLKQLETLSDEECARYCSAYWQRAGDLASAAKLFVDKLPLNVIYLPVVAKIFPDAKVIFARRDPRDVVFSCFRRRFAMTPKMYELLTLEGTARYYCAVMRLAELYRDKLGLTWIDVVYEDVVRDFDAEVRRLCRFLNLEWHAAMGDFAERLSKRSVDTPSSGQLVKGLSGESIGSWRRYREGMEPILGLLDPYVMRFGYS